jgi:hypothetical protein
MTAAQALKHPWLDVAGSPADKDLLPTVKEGFNARKLFKKAFGVVKAINKLSHTNLLKDSAPNSSNESLTEGV